ncbi:MAG: (2Fe-2S)-binding protein [Spirochaetales bacterium]|nr:(2Fe-2S)-binding protein [Leptospiraceae bacterium]MCP5479977.1 (2Fe-2S)-binding protein [Spirochaetales bacterium]MCP5486607.1 (2Fe-2S)-binding protein [Spirochaetales bacterium]
MASRATHVCLCCRVSAEDIREAVLQRGARNLEAVARLTGAATACLSCQDEVENLIQSARQELREAQKGQPLLPFL